MCGTGGEFRLNGDFRTGIWARRRVVLETAPEITRRVKVIKITQRAIVVRKSGTRVEENRITSQNFMWSNCTPIQCGHKWFQSTRPHFSRRRGNTSRWLLGLAAIISSATKSVVCIVNILTLHKMLFRLWTFYEFYVIFYDMELYHLNHWFSLMIWCDCQLPISKLCYTMNHIRVISNTTRNVVCVTLIC